MPLFQLGVCTDSARTECFCSHEQSLEEKEKHVCRSLFFIAKSMLMRDVFAALLSYSEFVSQFLLRSLAIP